MIADTAIAALAYVGILTVATTLIAWLDRLPRNRRHDPADDITQRDEWLDAMCDRALNSPIPFVPHSLGTSPGTIARPGAGDSFANVHSSGLAQGARQDHA